MIVVALVGRNAAVQQRDAPVRRTAPSASSSYIVVAALRSVFSDSSITG